MTTFLHMTVLIVC